MQYRNQKENKLTTSAGRAAIHQVKYGWTLDVSDMEPKELQSSSSAYHNARDWLLDYCPEQDYKEVTFYGYYMVGEQMVFCTIWEECIDLTEDAA